LSDRQNVRSPHVAARGEARDNPPWRNGAPEEKTRTMINEVRKSWIPPGPSPAGTPSGAPEAVGVEASWERHRAEAAKVEARDVKPFSHNASVVLHNVRTGVTAVLAERAWFEQQPDAPRVDFGRVAAAETAAEALVFTAGRAGSVGRASPTLHKKIVRSRTLLRILQRGAEALVEGGVLDVAFGSPVSAKPMVRAGQLKALGMTGPRRSPGMPEVPLFSEQGFAGFELAGYVAAYAPGGTPAPIVERLARELAAVIRMPEVTAKLIDQGQDPIANTPEQFRAAFQVEYPKWEALIRASGVQLQQ
jgi:hypothetical protein